jgi:hypothetical protein
MAVLVGCQVGLVRSATKLTACVHTSLPSDLYPQVITENVLCSFVHLNVALIKSPQRSP